MATASSSIEEEWRKDRAGRQLVTAFSTPLGLDGIAQVSEAIDITAERPGRDFQATGKFISGPEAPGLQEREQLQNPSAGRGSSSAEYRAQLGRNLAVKPRTVGLSSQPNT